MTRQSELTVEETLRSLYTLQLVDSERDQIEILKGELPMEVSDLEDEIAGLEKRIEKINGQLADVEGEINKHRGSIKNSELLIERYTKQLDDVKNNREFEALSKEIELQKLEIELFEKHIRQANGRIEGKRESLTVAQEKLDSRTKNLDIKKEELKKIIAKTEKQEKKLQKESVNARKHIEARYLKAYDKIRKTFRNGLAVVTVARDSCGGCFNRIPSQKQIEIGMRKKIMACEHCGRILVDEDVLETSVSAS
jgi:predicted  nucleic acid-binding Zn-ribbon protein